MGHSNKPVQHTHSFIVQQTIALCNVIGPLMAPLTYVLSDDCYEIKFIHGCADDQQLLLLITSFAYSV